MADDLGFLALQELVTRLDPRGGWRVVPTQQGDTYALYLGFYVNEQPVRMPWHHSDSEATRLVWKAKDPQGEVWADRLRLLLLLEALCRFLNTGGDKEQLDSAARKVTGIAEYIAGVSIVPGMLLVGSTVNCEGIPEHLFAGRGPWAVRWVENQYLEVVRREGVEYGERESAGASAPLQLGTGAGLAAGPDRGDPPLP